MKSEISPLRRENREGFWRTSGDSNLPMPVPAHDDPWAGKEEFLAALRKFEAALEPLAYKGMSTCRICGKLNGSREYSNGIWRWPSGYAHYIEVHNVRPSLAFQEFIMGEIE